MNLTTQSESSLALRSSAWSTKWSSFRFGTPQDKRGSGRKKAQREYALGTQVISVMLQTFSLQYYSLKTRVTDTGVLEGNGELKKLLLNSAA